MLWLFPLWLLKKWTRNHFVVSMFNLIGKQFYLIQKVPRRCQLNTKAHILVNKSEDKITTFTHSSTIFSLDLENFFYSGWDQLWPWKTRSYPFLRTTFINPFQPGVAFHIETSNLIYPANQMTSFYIKCNTGLKWVNKKKKERQNVVQWGTITIKKWNIGIMFQVKRINHLLIA